jgi:hypothetical protein
VIAVPGHREPSPIGEKFGEKPGVPRTDHALAGGECVTVVYWTPGLPGCRTPAGGNAPPEVVTCAGPGTWAVDDGAASTASGPAPDTSRRCCLAPDCPHGSGGLGDDIGCLSRAVNQPLTCANARTRRSNRRVVSEDSANQFRMDRTELGRLSPAEKRSGFGQEAGAVAAA